MAEASSTVLSSAALREIARGCGFDLCGFARPEPISPNFLVEWLEGGLAADMDWMSRRLEDRLDVRRLVPDAKTVAVFACNYYRTDEGTEASPIAKYARGRDYHYTMHDRLKAFRRGVSGLVPDVKAYACADSGLMMEKVWAARAGLGYVGKNGCFITEGFGSYVVLAAMVLNVEVDLYSSGPTVDRCGRCRLCVDACPTNAIRLNRRVDARDCLSFQTIENRGSIPEPLRPALQNVVFGCDICQDVCPLNAVAGAWGGARFAPRAVAQLDALALARLSPEEYQSLIPGTPLARAKYDGLRRNAAYALGAVRDGRAREVLERLLEDASDRVRDAARWALDRILETERSTSSTKTVVPSGT